MDDAESTVILSRIPSNEPLLPAEDLPGGAEASTPAPFSDAAAGLVSLSFLTAAIRRRVVLWTVVGAVGLLAGAGIFLHSPPPYQATSSVLLTLGPAEDITSAITTEVAMAQSRPVAAGAISELGLSESVTRLLNSYTATPVTNLVVTITVDSDSNADAVRIAGALATQYLKFRASQLQQNQQAQIATFSNQLAQASASITRIDHRIAQLHAQPQTTAVLANLATLQDQRRAAQTQLTTLQQNSQGNEEQSATATAAAVNGSIVLNAAAPLPNSRKKAAVEYGLGGLLGGLALGIGYVVVAALVSDKLRRRDDVAHALGAPVRLSLRRVRLGRVLPWKSGLTDKRRRKPAIQQIVAHLDAAVPHGQKRAALAVVAVDDTAVAALAVADLALARAQRNQRVIVADLSADRAAARLLGINEPGVCMVNVAGAELYLAVPESGDPVPTGPLPATAPNPLAGPRNQELSAAYAPGSLLLTLVTLDPAVGGEHLATWAGHAVAMITAGESTGTRIHAAGEMVRSAGTTLVTGILVGADKNDESLGIPEQHAKPDEDTATPDDAVTTDDAAEDDGAADLTRPAVHAAGS